MEAQSINPVLYPFEEKFICPNCGYLDTGKFCSQCSEPLLVDDACINTTLVKRLTALGYKPFDTFFKEEAEGVRNYDFSDFKINGVEIIYFLTQGVQGIRIELVIIGNDIILLPKFIKRLSEIFTKKIKVLNDFNSSLRRNERPENFTEYIERIDLKYLIITNDSSIYLSKENKLKTINLTVKTNLGFWQNTSSDGTSRKSRFIFSITFETISLDVETRLVNTNKSKLYNILLYNSTISLNQTLISYGAIKQKEKHNFLLNTILFIFESFIDYFKVLIQFFKSPYIFADLIISKKVIPFSKIINYYLVGLTFSVAFPILLSGGYISSDNLTIFNNLPPFIGDLAELGVEVLFLYIQVVIIHLIFKLLGYTGSLLYFFMGMLFIKSFFQIIDRPFNYLMGSPLSNFLYEINATPQYGQILSSISSLYMLVYFILYYPIVYTTYKVSPQIAGIAFSVLAVAFFILQYFVTKEIPFSEEASAQSYFHYIMNKENKINAEYKSKIQPAIEFGDKTGDYKAVLSQIPNIQQEMFSLAKDCKEYNKKNATIFTSTVSNYYDTKYSYFLTLEGVLKKKIPLDSLTVISTKLKKCREKIAEVPEDY